MHLELCGRRGMFLSFHVTWVQGYVPYSSSRLHGRREMFLSSYVAWVRGYILYLQCMFFAVVALGTCEGDTFLPSSFFPSPPSSPRCCAWVPLAQVKPSPRQTSCSRACLQTTCLTSSPSPLAPAPTRPRTSLTPNWTRGREGDEWYSQILSCSHGEKSRTAAKKI